MGGGTVYTMGGIPVTNGGPIGSLGHGLLTGVFDATHDSGARWVTSDQKVIEARARELELQADGRLDPNTPIRDERLTPTMRVEGELSYNDGRMTGEIRIVDRQHRRGHPPHPHRSRVRPQFARRPAQAPR